MATQRSVLSRLHVSPPTLNRSPSSLRAEESRAFSGHDTPYQITSAAFAKEPLQQGDLRPCPGVRKEVRHRGLLFDSGGRLSQRFQVIAANLRSSGTTYLRALGIASISSDAVVRAPCSFTIFRKKTTPSLLIKNVEGYAVSFCAFQRRPYWLVKE